MRATSMRRLLGGAAALLLAGATLLTASGSALGATTRFLYVGPDSNYVLNNGTLSFTPVSTGNPSASTVYVKNIDNQNLTHVVITFDQSQGAVSIADTVYGANASSCSAADDLITCDFGNLKAKATRSFVLVLSATSVGSFAVHGTVVFNESTNPNGGNTQINAVDGTIDVSATSCNALAAFLPPGQTKTFLPDDGTACPTDEQRSALGVPANANGNVVTVDDSALNETCAAGYSCFGHDVSANVNAGATVTPYLTWYITYSADLMQGINPRQVAFQHGDTVILAGKKGACGAVFTKDCIAGYTVDPTTGAVTFEIHSITNSVMKGLH